MIIFIGFLMLAIFAGSLMVIGFGLWEIFINKNLDEIVQIVCAMILAVLAFIVSGYVLFFANIPH